MAKWIGVLPYMHEPYMKACTESMAVQFRENLLLVDNTKENIGVMRSHNRGIDIMKVFGAHWLVVVGASIRFGEPGGMDFIKELDNREDHDVVEAEGVFGWHLIAFNGKLLDDVGRWDANLSPYGFDDIDLSLRIQKARGLEGKYPLWEKAKSDVKDEGMAHSIKLAGLEAPADPRIAYFKKKWGRHPGDYKEESYATPFNDPNNSLAYWPEYEGCRWDD